MKNEKNLRMLIQKLNVNLMCHPRLSYELSHCVEEPEYYTLRIEWDSEEGHIKGFRTSSEFKPFFEAVKPFFDDIQEMRHYNITHIKGEKS